MEEMPMIKLVQRAVRAARNEYTAEAFRAWADAWLSGADRTAASACRAAEDADWVARHDWIYACQYGAPEEFEAARQRHGSPADRAYYAASAAEALAQRAVWADRAKALAQRAIHK